MSIRIKDLDKSKYPSDQVFVFGFEDCHYMSIYLAFRAAGIKAYYWRNFPKSHHFLQVSERGQIPGVCLEPAARNEVMSLLRHCKACLTEIIVENAQKILSNKAPDPIFFCIDTDDPAYKYKIDNLAKAMLDRTNHSSIYTSSIYTFAELRRSHELYTNPTLEPLLNKSAKETIRFCRVSKTSDTEFSLTQIPPPWQMNPAEFSLGLRQRRETKIKHEKKFCEDWRIQANRKFQLVLLESQFMKASIKQDFSILDLLLANRGNPIPPDVVGTATVKAYDQSLISVVHHILASKANIPEKDILQLLIWTADCNDVATIGLLLANYGISISPNSLGLAASKAFDACHFDLAFRLLRSGPFIISDEKLQCRILLAAAKEGFSDIVEQLLASGVSMSREDRVYAVSETFRSGHEELAYRILKSRPFIVFKEDFSFSEILVAASRNGRLNIVKLLLKNGALVFENACDRAIIEAEKSGHKDIVSLFLKRRIISARNKALETSSKLLSQRVEIMDPLQLLMKTVESRDLSSIKLLLAGETSSFSAFPLREAIERAHELGYSDIAGELHRKLLEVISAALSTISSGSEQPVSIPSPQKTSSIAIPDRSQFFKEETEKDALPIDSRQVFSSQPPASPAQPTENFPEHRLDERSTSSLNALSRTVATSSEPNQLNPILHSLKNAAIAGMLCISLLVMLPLLLNQES